MCEFTEGKATFCDAPGGSKRAFMWSLKDSLGLSNYLTPPTVVDGEITAMALKPTKYIYQFNFEPETIETSATSIGEATNNATAHEHSTVLQLSGNTKEDIAAGTRAIKGRVGVALELNDGSFEVYHYEDGRGGKVQRTRSPGKMLDDPNGSIWTITSRQIGPEAKISSVLLLGMLAP